MIYATGAVQDLPVIGDWVVVTRGGSGDRLQIQAVLPRKSLLARRAIESDHEAQLLAANVDHVFVVSSLNHDLNPRRLERYRVLVDQSGTDGTLLLTKTDLVSKVEERQSLMQSVQHIFPCLSISSLDGSGMEDLLARLHPGSTFVFLGSSGVGKSTLINRLLGHEKQATFGVRESDSRGRHTTSSRSLMAMPNGALLIDTPGIRELALWNLDEAALTESFDELGGLAEMCRFRDCKHESEPGCSVQLAIDNGSLSRSRLESYRKLQKEQAFYERRADKNKQSAEKAKWKSIHKAMRKHNKQ